MSRCPFNRMEVIRMTVQAEMPDSIPLGRIQWVSVSNQCQKEET